MEKELKILDEDGRTLFDTDAHYVIPHLLAYAWKDKEIGQLIDDINGIGSSENYYDRPLIVSNVQGKPETYKVVDGQQRLITLNTLAKQHGVEKLMIISDEYHTLFDTNAKYVIPYYQRAYAWEDREIGQLIDDINGIDIDKNPPENYYIGSLIVSKNQGKPETYEVVDGQQRLITLFLLLQYLKVLKKDLELTLSFRSRKKSNDTLALIQKNIQEILDDEIDDESSLEWSIVKGIKAIHQKFKQELLDKDKFKSRLEQVALYRIEVPEHTDLNRYFEIMNTRGEQLEQHDILKAKLMGYLDDRHDQEIFSEIWNACSDMTDYVQMHFVPDDTPDDYQGPTIEEIVRESRTDDTKVQPDKKTHVHFDSIIDFPYFLLHALRVFVRLSLDDKKLLDVSLDDKKLLSDFNKVIDHGKMNGKDIKDDKENFSREFIVHLLKTRYLFDRFIIKREYSGEGSEGEWSLKELSTSEQGNTSYINTKLSCYNEQEGHKECLMIQSALRVSYTSPRVMHWITELILWLFKKYDPDQNPNPNPTDVAVAIAAQATKNFVKGVNHKLGVGTPHIVFNFLDYLLWKDDRKGKATEKKYEDFKFEFRNSVEHWYPQYPSGDSFAPWTKKDESGNLYVDGFGNLCIISRSMNSKFSNLSPTAKMETFEEMVKKGSIKLRLMADKIEQDKRSNANEDWKEKDGEVENGLCQKHEKEMINTLRAAVDDPKYKIDLYFVNQRGNETGKTT